MENLNKLKELEYLNLAVNNISKIEGVRGCESLAKLDLTLNFIEVEDLEESMENLSECEAIQDLYLTGNPCAQWEGCKEYVMAKVIQLKRLDGEEITRSQRLAAKQKLKQLEQELRVVAQESILKKQRDKDAGVDQDGYTKESRVKMYQELEDQKKQDEEKNKDSSMFKDFHEFEEGQKKREAPSVYNQFGDIRQCNEGKYEFLYSESPDKTCVILEMQIPKFMDTSLVNVDLNPQYIRMEIRGKITQLKHPDEIIVEKSKLQRSQTTGVLMITMPKSNINEVEARNMRNQQIKEDKEKQDKLRQLEIQQKEAKLKAKEDLNKQQQRAMDRNNKDFLIREREEEEKKEEDLAELLAKNLNVDETKTKNMFIPDFDESEVPPLE
eukprot:403333583